MLELGCAGLEFESVDLVDQWLGGQYIRVFVVKFKIRGQRACEDSDGTRSICMGAGPGRI